MTDYIVQIKVKNGPMMRAMRKAGYYTASALSRAANVSPGDVGDFLNLKRPPIGKRGDWAAPIIKIAETLNIMPEDLFPHQHITRALKKNTAEVSLDACDVEALAHTSPEQLVIEHDMNHTVDDLLAGLSPRQQYIIERSFGIKCEKMSLTDIATDLGISKGRVGQIEGQALRTLKKHHNKNVVRDALGIDRDCHD